MSLKTISVAPDGKQRCFPLNTTNTSFHQFSPRRLNETVVPKHQESIGDEPFYQSLQQYSSLYRIVLQRPIMTEITLDKWHRTDLELVNELGMAVTGAAAHICQMQLMCELLVLGPDGVVRDPEYSVQVRPLPFDAWEANDTSLVAPDYPGFQKSSAGGLEFMVACTNNDQQTFRNQGAAKTRYLRILPTLESTQTMHALPLVIATRLSSSHYQFPKLVDEARWGGIVSTGDMHRAFHFSDDKADRFFIIKEGWKLGTPGKMWDSALVLSDMFSQRIMQDPNCLDRRHIIDLSAGTGCAGLLFAYLYHHIFPQHRPKITLTDIPEALHLIRHNKTINLGEPDWLSIKKLRWGNAADARLVLRSAPLDIILASDVLYEPASFGLLVESLESLSTPDRTVIYLGYKRRGLKDEDEANFFRLCAAKFHIDLVQHNITTYPFPVDWERSFGCMTRLSPTHDGRGWLGYHPQEPETFAAGLPLETSVHIYRLVRRTNKSGIK